MRPSRRAAAGRRSISSFRWRGKEEVVACISLALPSKEKDRSCGKLLLYWWRLPKVHVRERSDVRVPV